MRTTAFEEYPHETALRLKKEAGPDMYDALKAVQSLIVEGAMQGFQPLVGNWADRLYHSQQATSRALAKARGEQS